MFDNLSDALAQANADAVIINTPSELHFDQAKTALEREHHVLVAKPITNSYEQAVDLVALAEDRQVTTSVGQQMRSRCHYQPWPDVSRPACWGRWR